MGIRIVVESFNGIAVNFGWNWKEGEPFFWVNSKIQSTLGTNPKSNPFFRKEFKPEEWN